MSEYPIATTNRAMLPSWEQMREFADVLVKSGFLPKNLSTPEKALAVMMAGREMGIPPMKAIAHLYVVDGKVIADGQLSLALAYNSGLLEKLEVVREEDGLCEMLFKRVGQPPITVRWTREQAKKAGLYKSWAWQNYEPQLLRWRCVTEGLRLVAPDTTLYTPEEVGVPFKVEGETVVIDHDELEDFEAQRDEDEIEPPNGDLIELSNGKRTYHVPRDAPISAKAAGWVLKIAESSDHFKHPNHLTNHLKKHFNVARPEDMTWGMYKAFVQRFKGGVLDGVYYQEEGGEEEPPADELPLPDLDFLPEGEELTDDEVLALAQDIGWDEEQLVNFKKQFGFPEASATQEHLYLLARLLMAISEEKLSLDEPDALAEIVQQGLAQIGGKVIS